MHDILDTHAHRQIDRQTHVQPAIADKINSQQTDLDAQGRMTYTHRVRIHTPHTQPHVCMYI